MSDLDEEDEDKKDGGKDKVVASSSQAKEIDERFQKEFDEVVDHIVDRVRRAASGFRASSLTLNKKRARAQDKCHCGHRLSPQFHDCLSEIDWTKDTVQALFASEQIWRETQDANKGGNEEERPAHEAALGDALLHQSQLQRQLKNGGRTYSEKLLQQFIIALLK